MMEYHAPADEAFLKRMADAGEQVRECKHPKLLFYEMPSVDGAAVLDGSEYEGTLMTGRDFGCVNHEPLENHVEGKGEEG